ncbi:N-acetylmuramoyl-L-alanine amidase family protein [Thiospirillum jenense]|uniref:N-acetylmuramoyl-L-alanine amidase n=1 Tax=Thiospirillum jenense TaxID=1653858 RepID=A0A839HC78_9GAMM|nr:N-acetylmuramoyl-L-alanine amidase [Thiospirillum jenense]MBB1126575.1 N-acetylmuramoyl-L-alanine amidase [Thiospirillum jenense]
MSTSDNSSQPALKAEILRGVLAQNIAMTRPRVTPPVTITADPAAGVAAPMLQVQPRRGWRMAMIASALLLIPRHLGWWAPSPPTQLAMSPLSWSTTAPLALPNDVTHPPPLFSTHQVSTPQLADALTLPLAAATHDAAQQLRLEALLAAPRIPIATLFGLQFRTIVIDPGHGGSDPGAIGPSGLTEKVITLDIAQRLRERLQRRDGYRVLLTRHSDTRHTLKERVAFARTAGADLFISLHFNTLPQRSVNVIETYYFGSQSDQHTAAIAAAENRGSEFALAEFKRLIMNIGNTLKTQESRDLAIALQAALVEDLTVQSSQVIDAGIKTAPFVLLLGVEVPSVLVEISCLSHPAEEQRLMTSAYRNHIATALERGLVSYLENQWTTRPSATGESTHVGVKSD